VVVRMINRRLFTAHVELCCGNARSDDALGPDGVAVDRKAAERTSKVLERKTGVEQRANDHVARCPREAVEIENRQAKPILSLPCLFDAALHAAGLHEGEVALVRKYEMVDDIDSHDPPGVNHSGRQHEVIGARCRITRRVVVEEHDSGR
jgi:hypothetical protein